MELCIFGAASDAIPEIYITRSEHLGQRLAERGHALVFGGGATGVMGAAARGVHRGGGRIVGVAPRFFDKPGVLTELCDELVFTETMDERKTLMEARAEGFIIAPGGVGTLDEFFEVITLRTLDRHGKPVALYNAGGFYDDLVAFLKKMEAESFVGPTLWDCLGIFDDADALLDYMEARRSPVDER